MIHHDNIAMFDTCQPPVLFDLDYGLLLREQADLEREILTDLIPRTVAHYASPNENDQPHTKEHVAEVIAGFGMDITPIYGSDGEPDLGLILEHVSEINSGKFLALIDGVSCTLHKLGWNYDGWVCEDVSEVRTVH